MDACSPVASRVQIWAGSYNVLNLNIFSVNSSAVDAVTCFDVQVAVDICKNIAAIYQMINDHKMGQTISISIYKTPTLEMK